MKNSLTNILLTAFILAFAAIVIILILETSFENSPIQYGRFDFHDISKTIKWFTGHGKEKPVTYTSVFSVENEGDWLHVAAVKSTLHDCLDEGFSDNHRWIYLYENDLKYFLLNKKTGFNSGPLSEYGYVSESESSGLRYKLKSVPERFDPYFKKTIASECYNIEVK